MASYVQVRTLICVGLLTTTSLSWSCGSSYTPLTGLNTKLSAGSPVVRCYSRLAASEAEIEYALRLLWERYPENRITSVDIQQIKQPNPAQPGFLADAGSAFTEQDAFQQQVRGPYKKSRYSWGLKLANGKAICSLAISNGNELCLSSVTFLPVGGARGNWQLTPAERAQAQIWFEEDILTKLKALISETRKKRRTS